MCFHPANADGRSANCIRSPGNTLARKKEKNCEKEYVITSVSGAPKPPPHWVCKNSSWEFSFNIEVEEIHLKLLR